MVDKAFKRFHFIKFLDTFPEFSLGSTLVAIFCSFFIVMATFSPIPLRILAIPGEALYNAAEFFASLESIDQITRVLNYIPQIPIVIMIAAILGPRLGALSIGLYVTAGLLGLPVFASGGGLGYLGRIGTGYILGFFAGVFLTGKLLSIELNKLSIARAAIFGVISIHIVGILYLAALLLFRHESVFSIFGWAWQLSGMQILYDVIFAVAAAFLGRFIRKLLWVIMD